MSRLKQLAQRLLRAVDGWQRRSRIAGPAWAVSRKFGDDDATLFVVALGWYGFTAIYPLLLVVVSVFGFLGAARLGSGVVTTLHQFPIIGTQFSPAGSSLHGSPLGLVIGVIGLVYGAQGVTQMAEQAMARVWNQPVVERPGFVPRLLRSLGALATIGGSFVLNAVLGAFAGGHGHPLLLRAGLVAVMAGVNVLLYLATFRILTSADASLRQLLPGSVLGGVAFTALITVGAGLVQHQLRHASQTYGALAAVIGVVTFLLLLAKISLYAAELNPVLARRLWPRSLPSTSITPADEEVLRARVEEQRRRLDEQIGVGFGDDAREEAAERVGSHR